MYNVMYYNKIFGNFKCNLQVNGKKMLNNKNVSVYIIVTLSRDLLLKLKCYENIFDKPIA